MSEYIPWHSNEWLMTSAADLSAVPGPGSWSRPEERYKPDRVQQARDACNRGMVTMLAGASFYVPIAAIGNMQDTPREGSVMFRTTHLQERRAPMEDTLSSPPDHFGIAARVCRLEGNASVQVASATVSGIRVIMSSSLSNFSV